MAQLFCSMVSDDDSGLSTVAWEHNVLILSYSLLHYRFTFHAT